MKRALLILAIALLAGGCAHGRTTIAVSTEVNDVAVEAQFECPAITLGANQ